eukprot:261983-Amorphochlora_amoeboformis.AAC.1
MPVPINSTVPQLIGCSSRKAWIVPHLRLDLESLGSPAAPRLLELASLRPYIRLDVRARGSRRPEVLDGLAGVLGSAQEDGARAIGADESKLIEGDALTAGFDDAGASRVGEAESADAELGHLEEANVIGDGADEDRDFLGFFALGGDGMSGSGKRWWVGVLG